MRWRLIKSVAMLAWAFWARQVRRVFKGRRDDGGLDRFIANYAPDGMPPMTRQDEQALLSFGACIQCGLCEAVCPEPVDRWLAYGRALTLAAEAANALATDCPEGCSTCADICPTGVEPLAVAAFVRQRAVKLGAVVGSDGD